MSTFYSSNPSNASDAPQTPAVTSNPSSDTLQVSGLRSLFYRDGAEWQALPGWVYDLLNLGAHLSTMTSSQSRRVLALKVPVRSFAAAFLGAGIVLERTLELAASERRAKRFEQLWELEDGSSVYIFQNSTRFRGIICKHEDNSGERRLRVKTEETKRGMGAEWIVPSQLSHIVQPVKGEFHLRGKQKGTKVKLPDLLNLLSADFDVPPAWYSSVECLIAGTATLLEEEMSLELRLQGQTEGVEGTLCDLLLPQRCVPKGDIYRSDIVPSTAEDILDDEPLLADHTTVVIDGATAFLRMGDLWPSSTMVVLLDPHEGVFGEAVQQLNRWYVTRRLSDIEQGLADIPSWLDAMTFLEKVHDGT